MKKNIINVGIIFIILTLVLYFSLKDNFTDIINQITHLNIWWLLAALVLLIGYWLCRGLSDITV